jgi:hypothetical protein
MYRHAYVYHPGVFLLSRIFYFKIDFAAGATQNQFKNKKCGNLDNKKYPGI